uniref:acid phosphatase n=1 Tax=Timema poppense TaxID=170557 RepID=A0A7R9HB25_TIMPO|nr:unnamed protein product [Timema poppensis]
MALIVIAGVYDCQSFAHVDYVANHMSQTLPNFKVHRFVKSQEKWQDWLDKVCKKHNWSHHKSPLVWKEPAMRGGDAVYIGGASEFSEYCYEYYGFTCYFDKNQKRYLVEENIQTLKSPVVMEHFTLSTVLVVALLLSTGFVRSLPVDTGDDLGTIIFSSVLFRHGDRAPTGSYPNGIYNDEAKYWPRGYGQLSEIGEEQHFKQGSFFRKRYNHILPETYNVNDTYVRSSNIDRTLASARAHLAGLYPPTEQNLAQPNINFQVIPIHTTDMVNDKKLYNLSIPEWASSYYPQPLGNLFLLESFIAAAGTEELQRLSTGPLLKEIIANTQAKVNGTLSPDRGLYIYSAHDSNVVDLLQGLDVFNGILVPYASAVMIELRSKSDEYFITVSYKNSTKTDPYLLPFSGCDAVCPLYSSVSYKNSTELDPHLLQLPGCDALCPLDSFVELTKPIIPDDLTTECAEEVVAGQEYHFEIPAAAILPEWEHCFQQPTVKDGRFHRISFTTKNHK